MNSNEAKKLALTLQTDFQEIDLHGIYPEEALTKLDQFLYDTSQSRHQFIKIIYGIGSGTLKKSVLSYIGDHPLVEEWIDQGGSCAVLLHQHDLIS